MTRRRARRRAITRSTNDVKDLIHFQGVYRFDRIQAGNQEIFYGEGYGMTNDEALIQGYCWEQLHIGIEGTLVVIKNNMDLICAYSMIMDVEDSLTFNEDCKVKLCRTGDRLSVIRTDVGEDRANEQLLHFTFQTNNELQVCELLVEMEKLGHKLSIVLKKIRDLNLSTTSSQEPIVSLA